MDCVFLLFSANADSHMNKQEGASDTDLRVLPKYRYVMSSNEEKAGGGAGRMIPVETSGGYLANERVLLPEDAVS